MKKRVCLLMVMVCLAVFSLAETAGATRFVFQDLSSNLGLGSRPAAINDTGQIAFVTSTSATAFLWTPGVGLQNLGTLGGTWIVVSAVNNSGQVVGQSNNQPFIWSSGTGMHPLGITNGRAASINDAGAVVGQATFGSYLHAFYWTLSGGMQDLTPGGGYTQALAINQSGQIAGSDGSNLCLLFLGQPPQVLFTEGYPLASAMNSQGNIVGEADLDGLGGMGQAFFYNLNAAVMTNLTPGDYGAWGYGINNANQVVGNTGMNSPFPFQAFFWSQAGGLKELNKLVRNLPGGVTLQLAAAINNKGQIVGMTSNNQPYLLTPTSLPPLNLLLD